MCRGLAGSVYVSLSWSIACGQPSAGDQDGTTTLSGSDTSGTGSDTSGTSPTDPNPSTSADASTVSSADTGTDTGAPCDCPDDGNPCTDDVCDLDGECTHPLAPAGTTCRPSSGECDLAEQCDGIAPSCPTDLWDGACACPSEGPITGYAEHDGRPLLGPTKAVRASEAWYSGNRNLQGAVSIEGKFLLTATRYSGALFTGVVDQASTVHRASNGDWAWMPEGIHYDPQSGRVLIDTEGHANMPRLVFAANADQIP